MKRQIRIRRAIAGFTLLEVLVVVAIIGILFAIAAPGWDTFLSRQRITAAREQVLQTIQQAQNDARKTKAPQIVRFDPNSNAPRYASKIYNANSTTLSSFTWKKVGDGNIASGTISLKTNNSTGIADGAPIPPDAIVFDASGAVAKPPVVPTYQKPYTGTPFIVTVSRAGVSTTGTDRCVRIETILGATRLAEGSSCQ